MGKILYKIVNSEAADSFNKICIKEEIERKMISFYIYSTLSESTKGLAKGRVPWIMVKLKKATFLRSTFDKLLGLAQLLKENLKATNEGNY